MEYLTRGQLAKKAQVGTETVRYYERRGLIPEPDRRESGYRQYPPETVTRIQFIKHAKELGFSLTEIHELLSLQLNPALSCSEVKKIAEAKIRHIDEKIGKLQRMKRSLTELTRECSGNKPVSDCNILKALEQHSEIIS
jgi:MerR family mercuric resistance operon transcriptional regulator